MKHILDENASRIILTVHTGNYPDSVAVSMKAFLLAERMDHHPSVITDYGEVTIEISTHSAGNKVTDKDRTYIKKLVESLGH